MQQFTVAADIIISAKRKNDTLFWRFTQSVTGQLDFCGRVDVPVMENGQTLDGDSYFSPSWYYYLPENLCAEFQVFLSDSCVILDAGMFAFLMHIGALLLAVEEKEGLLAAELFSRRSEVFMEFPQLTLFILESVAVEGLFAWLYGQFSDSEAFTKNYRENTMISSTVCDTGTVFFEAAKKRLQPDPQKETPEEMFTRYFRTHDNTSFTIGIVGAHYRSWDKGLELLDSVLREQTGNDIVQQTEKVQNAKRQLLGGIAAAVQAEPYNSHDSNAVAVLLERIEAKIAGNRGKTLAGYIRATGAAIIRAAKPKIFHYNAQLARIGNIQDGRNGIVVRVTV